MRYLYSVVRYVPEPARGEFINIGVLVGNPESNDWHLQHASNLQRALSAGTRMAFKTARAQLDRIDERVSVHEQSPLAVDWLTSLAESARSVLQLSPPTPISAASATEAAEVIFNMMVVDPTRRERASAGAAKKALQAAYRTRIPIANENVHSRVTALVDGQSAQFDFAIANGHLVQLSKAWSFNVRAADAAATSVRSWGYAVALIRDGRHQATVNTGPSQQYPVADSVDIAAVYIPPTNQAGQDALGRSLQVFETLGVTATPLSKVTAVADRAAAALAA